MRRKEAQESQRDQAEEGRPSDVQSELQVKARGLSVRGLRVVLPGGGVLISKLDLEVKPGQIAVVLGGSGSGKSTFSRVLFELDQLRDEGFEVSSTELRFDRSQLGLVPQRGALFDHLDVRDNLDIALRYSGNAGDDPLLWLERVGLDPSLGSPGTPVAQLSGGQAQRVSVARALAGRRQLLFLDEPTVGLDPYRLELLAKLLRREVDELGLCAVVVTHDVGFATAVADQLHILDPTSRELVPMLSTDWPGPLVSGEHNDRSSWLERVEAEVIERLRPKPSSLPRTPDPWISRVIKKLVHDLASPFTVAGIALQKLPRQLFTRTSDALAIASRVTKQALVRPLPFYAIVSVLIGYTILYVISKVGGAGVRPDALLRQIGGSYIVALAPPLSALLFVAASGAATNAWLGSLDLTRQVRAMEALGIDSRSYLWSPTWVALAVAYYAVAATFAAGMLVGGLILCHQLGVENGYDLLTADLFDPRPSRASYLLRSLFLIWIFGWGISSDIVAKGSARKSDTDEVTRAMTKSVIACTLWVVGWELVTAMFVFGA